MNILIGLVVALAAVGFAVYAIIIYNELVRLRNDNDRAWANIDVLLKQRHDEIPNLVETVKGYMQHERQTLLAVTQARTASMSAATVGQKAQADLLVAGALRGLFAAGKLSRSESEPKLLEAANSNFRTRRADRGSARVLQRRCKHVQHPHQAGS
jgi:LemA protein